MSNPKNRNLPETMSMYLVILVLYCVDIFFLQSDRTVLADAFYSRCASLIVLFSYIWFTKSSVTLVGISTKKKKISAALIYGTLFTVIPMIIVMAVECIYYGLTDISSITLKFTPPSLAYVRRAEHMTTGGAIAVYFLTTVVGSVFKEFFFRGFLLKRFKKSLKFNTANVLQAVLYMFMTMPMLLRNLVTHTYDDTTASLGVFIVMFYIIHETLAGIKWGLLTRVTGSTYMAIVDHSLFVFLANSVYITTKYVTWSFMTHMLLIQVVSFVLVLIYYKKNMKKLQEKREQAKEERKEKIRQHVERRKEREKNNIIDKKLREINEISPDQYKEIVEETNNKRRRHHTSKKRQAQNEINSAANQDLIEQKGTADAEKVADEYLQKKLHHHHHSSERQQKRNEANSAANEGLIEQRESSEAGQIADEYLQKKLHHHHHSSERQQKRNEANSAANEGLIEQRESSEAGQIADEYLQNNLHHHHHHHHSHANESDNREKIDDISDDFDTDKFLSDFQKSEEARRSGHSGSSHHHHHHSHHHHRRSEDDVVSMTEVSTDDFFDEYQKTVEEKKEKKKQKFIQRMRDLGKIDDSASNDLL